MDGAFLSKLLIVHPLEPFHLRLFSHLSQSLPFLESFDSKNAMFFALYLRSTLGFMSRTRYSCSSSVNTGHVMAVGPTSGGFGVLKKDIKASVFKHRGT